MESELNWILLFKENFNTLITVSSTLLGLVLGSTITVLSQSHFFKKQVDWEKKKMEDEKLAELIANYNNILLVNGEVDVIDYHHSGNVQIFHPSVYVKEMRPLLFQKFHLLHFDIAQLVKEIDGILLKWTVLEEEGYEGEREVVAGLYLDIIEKVDNQVNLNRNNQIL